ncbi:MAG TPA: universal stress protein [Anaeromyxobacteraceae bacterium]|nr:universal stress protein [Anaeromyxobacteraceae bacterium]
MPGWTKILCPIDFSDNSRRGMHEALEIAKAHGARVYLLHVLEEPWPGTRGDPIAPPEFLHRLNERVQADLATWKKDADAIAPGKVITEMIGGHPATEIVRVAREGGFDLVVMGTHGRRGLRRLFIGSVTEEVIRTAPCSVLAVRPRDDFQIQPD